MVVSDPAVAGAVAAEARRRGIMVNAADDPARCDFILPSVLRRGRLVVSVSTGGASPGLARAIREALEGQFGADYAALVDLVAEVRGELRAAGVGGGEPGKPAPPRIPASAWARALDPDLRALVAAGQRDAARDWLRGRLEEAACRLTGRQGAWLSSAPGPETQAS